MINVVYGISAEDLQEIVSLHNRILPSPKSWTFADAKAQFLDIARGQGRNVIRVYKNKELLGTAGWVSDSVAREFFGTPLFVSQQEAADQLVGALLDRAELEQAKFVRVGCYKYEIEKENALRSKGFNVSFDFIELEIAISGFINPPELKFKFLPADKVEAPKYKDLYNSSFKDVSNALPVTDERALELWAAPEVDKDLSGVWLNEKDQYVAFLLVHKNGYLDSIGIHPDFQKRGIGSLIYQATFFKAQSLGIKKLHVTVADNNKASLKLHDKYGFVETERRQVWQFNLNK